MNGPVVSNRPCRVPEPASVHLHEYHLDLALATNRKVRPLP